MLGMISGGASCANMSAFYGINKAAYTQIAQPSRAYPNNDIGRPPVPDEHTQRFIWSVWLQYEDLDDPHVYLAVHAVTQIKIRTLWQLMNEWQAN